ncbi:hypothetical protein ACJX0J_037169, partial [Zea mays]
MKKIDRFNKNNCLVILAVKKDEVVVYKSFLKAGVWLQMYKMIVKILQRYELVTLAFGFKEQSSLIEENPKMKKLLEVKGILYEEEHKLRVQSLNQTWTTIVALPICCIDLWQHLHGLRDTGANLQDEDGTLLNSLQEKESEIASLKEKLAEADEAKRQAAMKVIASILPPNLKILSMPEVLF